MGAEPVLFPSAAVAQFTAMYLRGHGLDYSVVRAGALEEQRRSFERLLL